VLALVWIVWPLWSSTTAADHGIMFLQLACNIGKGWSVLVGEF